MAYPFIKGHIVSPWLSNCSERLILEYLPRTKPSSHRPNYELLDFLKYIDYADSICSGAIKVLLSTSLIGIIRESA